MKVLSLFSGVGGFDMGLEAAGMTTVFQCEIDKHARSVLDYHWPDVPKWDDVSTLTGAHILEMTGGVDLVAWGSPCQDLSLAGKRAGLTGERSGLFHQGIRIIKELRELTNGSSPTWSIWENVVGALSSNGGADFGEVLYEMDEAGACFSEWSVLDAQYFGVPQRRRRVFVTTCFDSDTSLRCAEPLLPVSQGLRGDSATGGEQGQGATRETQDRIGTSGQWAAGSTPGGILTTSVTSKWHKGTGGPSGSEHYNLVVEPIAFDTQFGSNAGVFEDQSPTLKASQQPPSVAYPIDTRNALRDPDKRDAVNRQGLGVGEDGDPSPTLTHMFIPAVAYSIREDAKANNFSATEIETARALQALQPSVQSHHAQTFITQEVTVFAPSAARKGGQVWEGIVPTLKAEGKQGDNTPHVIQETDPLIFENSYRDGIRMGKQGLSQTLSAKMGTGGLNTPMIAQEIETVVIDRAAFNQGTNAAYDPYIKEDDAMPPLVARGPHAIGHGTPMLVVRRLTPLECERLMGWPDNHTSQGTNGVISDSQRFKMCGNGVASPVAAWIAKHILAV
jgi:DNA (cytosine-5)-methyltransferase 1